MMPGDKPTPYATLAPLLHALGYAVLPTLPGSKRPAVPSWQTAHERQDEMLALTDTYASSNVSTLCRDITPLDADIYERLEARKAREIIYEVTGYEPHQIPTRVGQAPKTLYILRRVGGPRPKLSTATWRHPTTGSHNRLEILGDGQQVVLYGRHPDTGQAYFWVQRDIVANEVRVEELPPLTPEQEQELIRRLDEMFAAAGYIKVSSGQTTAGTSGDVPMPVSGLTLELAAEALAHLPEDDATDYHHWVGVGMALHQQFNGYAEAYDLWDEWSSKASNYRGPEETWHKWQTFDTERPGGITMRSILSRAEQLGWQRPESVEGARVTQDNDWPEIDDPWPEDHEDEPEPDTESQRPASAEEFPSLAPEKPEKVKLKDGQELEILPLSTPDSWGDYRPGPQSWVWDQLLPAGETSVLYADGGVGKTALAQLLGTCVALGEPCLGNDTDPGRALLVLCEDNLDDAIRRQDRICDQLVVTREQIGERLALIPRKGEDSILMHFPRNDSMGTRTPFWKQLAATAQRIKPRLIVVDTAADTFGGNENIRAEVRQYVQRALTHIAERCNCSVLLLAHVSRAGAQDGTGGSTAWNNTVRSRLFLRRDEQRDGLLVLEHRKTNRGPTQDDKLLRMVEGVPVLVAGEDAEELLETEKERACRADFLAMLRAVNHQGNEVTAASNSPRYAPKEFAKRQAAILGPSVRWSIPDYEEAMHWLQARDHVVLETRNGGRVKYLVEGDNPNAEEKDEWLV